MISRRIEPQYFDWTFRDGPFTTDPEQVGYLDYGKHNVVTCDGVDVGPAFRYITGDSGWVDVYVLDADGSKVLEIVDLWDQGRVVLDRKVERQVSRPTPDGGIEHRYKERFKVKRIHGRVEYFNNWRTKMFEQKPTPTPTPSPSPRPSPQPTPSPKPAPALYTELEW